MKENTPSWHKKLPKAILYPAGKDMKERNGVGVLFKNDGINTLDLDSKFCLTVMAGVAQDELWKLSSRLKFGYRLAIKNGHVLGNDKLWGYNKEKCVLTVNEEEARVIRRIFQFYANEQLGVRRISQQILTEGITSRNTTQTLSGSPLPYCVLPLKLTPELLECLFLNAGYIAAGDSQPLCHHPLGQGLSTAQAVPHANDLLLPPGQHLIDEAVKLFAFHFRVDIVDNVIIHRHGIHQCQGVAGFVRFDRFIDGHVLGALFPAAEKHEDLVFNTPGSIAGKLDALFRVEAVYGLDQPDSANGDQILLVILVGVVFLNDMRYQPEVVLDQLSSGSRASLRHFLQALLFLLGAQRLWKRPSAGNMQKQVKNPGKKVQQLL